MQDVTAILAGTVVALILFGAFTFRPNLTRFLRLRWALLILAALLGVYAALLHPWMMNWGSTEAEQRRILPGDEVGADPSLRFTRAITIEAPVARVWPWLLQVGQDRAGFYSNDWLENLAGGDIHNADDLRLEWQRRSVGEAVPMARQDLLGGSLGESVLLRVTALEPELMIADLPGRFVLLPVNDRATRLLLREPLAGPEMGEAFAFWVWDPMHFVMEQRMLRGIKERAEGRTLVPLGLEVVARVGWVVAGLAVAGLFLSRRRWLPWGLLSAGLMIPSFSSTGDLDAALAGFLAVGISLLGALACRRRWLAPYSLLAAAVLLVLLLAPDAFTTFGLIFDLIAAAGLYQALTYRRRLERAESSPSPARGAA